MTRNYVYNNYIKNISTKYSSLLNQISVHHNFDLGQEFEQVIYKMLQKILPSKYGVCRGFLVSEDGQSAGDDIIIYDRSRFPQIRLIDENDFANKQEIPIEAAYAYIEAKHSLISGKNNKGNDNSLIKAMKQVSKAKKLVSKRKPMSILNLFNPYINFRLGTLTKRKNWPESFNPFFTAIISRNVKTKNNKILNDAIQITDVIAGDYDDDFSADMLVAGQDVCYIPAIKDDKTKSNYYHSPFYIEDISILHPVIVKDQAFAIGMCSLFYALDTIRLGVMPWDSIIVDSTDMEN